MSFAAVAAVVVIAVFAFARTPSDAADGAPSGGQTTSSITADTSGSFAELVQRANGLYDKGAQAFQDDDQNAGVQHFAAAAKVYAAAWKQQATDPNVGTDYATSLFYSGDTDGALNRVNEVLARSPDFQTAHLNKGVYLETAAQVAREGGQTAEADSLLAQAKAAYEKAASIDPGSSAGAKAAESLKGL
jgi:tetratricopeptide (TPR) repeat protein